VGSSKTKNPYLVISTSSTLAEAKKIAASLVRKKIAACVNVLPNATSYFRWEGKIDKAKECLLMIKTEKRKLKDVENAILNLHSYSTPEIIGLPIKRGSKKYLDWLARSVS